MTWAYFWSPNAFHPVYLIVFAAGLYSVARQTGPFRRVGRVYGLCILLGLLVEMVPYLGRVAGVPLASAKAHDCRYIGRSMSQRTGAGNRYVSSPVHAILAVAMWGRFWVHCEAV